MPKSLHASRLTAATALLAVAALSWGAGELVFDSEVIRLSVAGDTLRVEGLYRFLNGNEAEHIALFYPYPVDSLLGAAWTESLDWHPAADSEWQPLAFAEDPRRDGLRWRVPLGGARRPEVRTVYCQLLRGNYARYIVTTTKVWQRPLRHARFEVTLPPGATLVRASYDFKERDDGVWVYEAERFLPEVDIIVEWEFGKQ